MIWIETAKMWSSSIGLIGYSKSKFQKPLHLKEKRKLECISLFIGLVKIKLAWVRKLYWLYQIYRIKEILELLLLLGTGENFFFLFFFLILFLNFTILYWFCHISKISLYMNLRCFSLPKHVFVTLTIIAELSPRKIILLLFSGRGNGEKRKSRAERQTYKQKNKTETSKCL